MARKKLTAATVQQVAQAWATGFGGAGTAYQAGVQNTSKDPTALAVAAGDRYLSGVSTAYNNKTWQNGLMRAGKQGWQQGCVQKGVPRLASGATVGGQHYAAFLAQWQPFLDSAKSQLPARGSYDQNMARQRAMSDAMHAVKGKYKKAWRGAAGLGG